MAIKLGWNDGHTTSGIGTGAAGIIKETDRNRRVGAKARHILLNEYEGVSIIDCTFNVSSNDMAEAVNKANANNCDVFISNHGNAGGGYGFESFYSRKSTQRNIDRTKIIHNRLVKTKSCLANRRCCDDFSYKGYDLYVLINTKMEAHLFELGFVDNQKCVDSFNDDEVARALAEGIAEAYNIKKKTGSIPTNPPGPSGEMYRVRKSWSDAASQKGAYSDLNNAKKECDKFSGYNVYNGAGAKVYPANSVTPPTPNEMYRVRKSWADASSQKGAYSDLENAKNECNKYAGYSVYNSAGKSVFSTSPVVAPPAPPKPTPSNKKYLNLKPHMQSWKIYNQNGPYTTNKAIASLAPAKFGGLSYEILGSPQTDIHLIQTEQFGKVAIYAPRDNDSSITTTKLY